MPEFVHARLQPGRDDGLIAWLSAQPEGGRSEAIRALMRDGLRMRQLEANLMTTVRQAVTEALIGLQLGPAQQDTDQDIDEVESAFGDQLDKMLDQFG